MADCNIVKRHSEWIYNWQTGTSRSLRVWCAVCPKCSNLIKGSVPGYYSVGGRNTRKTAKDALHLHMKTKH